MPPETDYEVGYGKPPKHTRFRKGQSGNPRGRPRGTKQFATVLGEALNEKVTVNENGRQRKITKGEAVIKQLVNHAAQGDYKSTRDLIKLVRELQQEARSRKAHDSQSAPSLRHVLVLPDNHRDPRDPGEVAALIKASDEYHANKECEQERQNPANDNEEEAPNEHRTAA